MSYTVKCAKCGKVRTYSKGANHLPKVCAPCNRAAQQIRIDRIFRKKGLGPRPSTQPSP